MALPANVLLRRPDVLSHNPFCGLPVSHIPCLRDFRHPGSGTSFWKRSRLSTQCTAGRTESTGRHPNGLPQAHITALDNRAGVEELLALLRNKQPGRAHAGPLASSEAGVFTRGSSVSDHESATQHGVLCRPIKWSWNCIFGWNRSWRSWSVDTACSAAHADCRCCIV